MLSAKQKVGTNKIILGFAAVAATAVISTTGFAAAAQNNTGPGYGGSGHQVNTDVDVNVKGHHNIVEVVVNYFFS